MNINKLIVSIVGAVAVTIQAALVGDGISPAEWVTVGAAALAAVGTWLVPNTPTLATAKTWVNALVVAAGVLLPLMEGGITGHEWVTVVIAVLTAAGVYTVPNTAAARMDHGPYAT